MPKKHTVSPIKIKELLTPAEFAALYPLIEQLNPELSRKQYNAMLKQARADGYRCFGGYHGKKLVAACGIWIMTRFWCGKFMEIDNLVVDQSQRNAGIGKLLLDEVEAVAKREKCQMVLAASYTHNTASHRFYFREKYIIRGFVFTKSIPA
jgi:GNAT superfamily N-acetyltransferase